MSLVERCKTKYQKRKVLYNLAGVMVAGLGAGMVMTDGN